MHYKFIVILILSSLSSLLFSQGEGKNIIGGGFRMDRLSYEKSLDGIRKDIDLGIDVKYLRSLFPVHTSDSIHYDIINDSQKPLSRHWAGVISGFSGYYVISDSALMKCYRYIHRADPAVLCYQTNISGDHSNIPIWLESNQDTSPDKLW